MLLTGNSFYFEFEVKLMEMLQTKLSPALIEIISAFSMFGEETIMVMLLGFFYWSYDKQMGKTLGLNVLVATAWNPMMKNIAMRRRPYMVHEKIDIFRVVAPSEDPMNIAAQGYSFPSGHSTCAVATYGSIAKETRRRIWMAAAVVLSVLVGFSRVVVGAHYPTDVLVGWLVGLLAMFLVPFLRKKIKKTAIFNSLLLITILPGFFYCKSSDFFTSVGMVLGFMLAIWLEERFVHFENTRIPVCMILRVLGGGVLFFGLNILLKMPFSKQFLESGTLAANLVRTLRYFIIMILEIAFYPMLFQFMPPLPFLGKMA